MVTWSTLTAPERMALIESALATPPTPFWTETRQGLFAGWLIGFAIGMGALLS